MDLLQTLFNEGDDSELLNGPQGLDELNGRESFAIQAAINSSNLGGTEACDTAATDALWEDPFCVTTTAMGPEMLEAEANGDGISGSSDMQLSDSMSGRDGSPDDMGALANALELSETPSGGYGEGLDNFSLSNSIPDSKGAPQGLAVAPMCRKGNADQGDANGSHKLTAQAQSHASTVEHELPKVEDKEADIQSSNSSAASRAKPRDKTTQRKLRNKESARRYREKQVAKRRQLENFTRNLADQNQQLEMLHDKLLTLTCAHPTVRTGPQTSTTPLQDINN